jgi:hypothetical protein
MIIEAGTNPLGRQTDFEPPWHIDDSGLLNAAGLVNFGVSPRFAAGFGRSNSTVSHGHRIQFFLFSNRTLWTVSRRTAREKGLVR